MVGRIQRLTVSCLPVRRDYFYFLFLFLLETPIYRNKGLASLKPGKYGVKFSVI